MIYLKINIIVISFLIILLYIAELCAQDTDSNKVQLELEEPYFISYWSGTNSKMSLEELASYCAPIFWPSPDEPTMMQKKGKDIRIPQPFPFEENTDAPVVYYQLREILIRDDATAPAFYRDHNKISKSIIDLNQIFALQIDYTHYYEHERGAGMHKHDTEQAQFKIFVYQEPLGNNVFYYELIFLQVIAKAHALQWYDNIYSLDTSNVDYELEIPFHILIEEGKHAGCPDMNGDGYYTPGYDVNVRTNDAWGLRDVIRTGELFSSYFYQWMTKVRKPEHRILPPLPEDSHHRKKYTVNGIYAPKNAIYELRPFPSSNKAMPNKVLKKDMEAYEEPNWPIISEGTGLYHLGKWWEESMFIKSISLAFRANEVIGFSVSFPLFVVKNVEAPLLGGWLVNRIYFQDYNFRDFGYNIMYIPSASRYLDPYFSLGFEFDRYDIEGTDDTEKRMDFVMEVGIRIRANVKFSPLKFLSIISDFWGIRIGVKNKGFMKIKDLNYVFEFGMGVW